MVGSHTVCLFANGECEVEMGLGYHDGRYTMRGDTLRVTYREGLIRGLPAQFRCTPDHLLPLPTAQYPESIKIPGQKVKKGQ